MPFYMNGNHGLAAASAAQKTVWNGRGASLAPQVRFDGLKREAVDDGWTESKQAAIAAGDVPLAPPTTVTVQLAKSIISRNDSPDLPFSQSINPYYGCEHGCSYCYARPSYAYWGLSPGLDFETKLFAKPNAAELLRKELSRPGYQCSAISLGANTDPYQPAEREWKITRSILEVCSEFNQPVGIVTKNALVERDIGILAAMAQKGLAKVFISCASLDAVLARKLEPRASAPYRRIETIKRLAEAGIPVGVISAPVIPMINDSGLEAALTAAHQAGATEANYVLIRLAHELKELFKDWLATHFPERAEHVMSLIRQSRGGRENDPRFGHRMKGEGAFADLIALRFKNTCKRLGLHERRLDGQMMDEPGLSERRYRLDTSKFCVPKNLSGGTAKNGSGSGPQLQLF